MRRHLYLFITLICLPPASGGVVDRVAIVIGKDVVTESELLDDLRLTEFINNEPLDLNPAARRAAAEHLVDQELLRRQLQLSGYNQPPAAGAGALLRKFREQRFHSAGEYHAALQKYGITEDQLQHRLLWQLTAVRFIDFRFGSGQAGVDTPSATAASTADQQMDAWLKQARADTQIVFKPEAFE